jgi:hypothetical protein
MPNLLEALPLIAVIAIVGVSIVAIVPKVRVFVVFA